MRSSRVPAFARRLAGFADFVGCVGFTVIALGCPPRSAPRPPVDPGDPAADGASEPLPDPVAQPTNRAAGEILVVAIPRADGEPLDLRQLHGRAVILELSATWVDGWAGRYALYNGLLRRYGPDALAILLVAMDGERGAWNPEPGLRGPGYELGWDPQGAVAAQLQVAALPTVLLLDTEGRIVATWAAERAADGEALAAALDGELAAILSEETYSLAAPIR